MKREVLVDALAARVAQEEDCNRSALVALRKAATLVEQRLEGSAADAAAEALASVAAEYAKRNADLRPLAAGLNAMVAARSERASGALEGLLAASRERRGNGAEASAKRATEADSSAEGAVGAGDAQAPSE